MQNQNTGSTEHGANNNPSNKNVVDDLHAFSFIANALNVKHLDVKEPIDKLTPESFFSAAKAARDSKDLQ